MLYINSKTTLNSNSSIHQTIKGYGLLLRNLFCLTFVITLFVSCQNRQVRRVAQGYLDATANYRIDEAMPYASEQTREQTLPFIKNTILPMTDSSYIASNIPATIRIDHITIEGDSATVEYTKETPIKQLQGTLHLVREGGRWLAYVPLVLPESVKFDPQQLNFQTTIQQ